MSDPKNLPQTTPLNPHHQEGMKYVTEGIKTLTLLNGAAAIALISFFGNTGTKKTVIVEPLAFALMFFGIGALTSAFVFLSAYLAQLHYGNVGERAAGVRWHWISYGLFGVSAVFFLVGVIAARCALLASAAAP